MKKLVVVLIAVVSFLLCGRALMHAASATHILDNGTVVKMDLWYKEIAKNSGAYLYVNRSGKWSEIEIDTWDWAHWVRTNLYRTPKGELVVVHPFGGPPTHIIPLDGEPIRNWAHQARDSDTWSYLGAFDWRRHNRRFDFIPPSEQAECIPMGGGSKGESYQPRTEYQRDNCPSP